MKRNPSSLGSFNTVINAPDEYQPLHTINNLRLALRIPTLDNALFMHRYTYFQVGGFIPDITVPYSSTKRNIRTPSSTSSTSEYHEFITKIRHSQLRIMKPVSVPVSVPFTRWIHSPSGVYRHDHDSDTLKTNTDAEVTLDIPSFWGILSRWVSENVSVLWDVYQDMFY
jgi:hypothetical protein